MEPVTLLTTVPASTAPVGLIVTLPMEGLAVIVGCSRLERISFRALATDIPSVAKVAVPV